MLEAAQRVCLRQELSQIYRVVDDVGFQLLHRYWHLHWQNTPCQLSEQNAPEGICDTGRQVMAVAQHSCSKKHRSSVAERGSSGKRHRSCVARAQQSQPYSNHPTMSMSHSVSCVQVPSFSLGMLHMVVYR